MDATLILWPVVVQILLTMTIFILLGIRKAKALKAGEVDRKKAALYNSAWPDYVLKVSNNISNQFQTPILFYTLAFAFQSINAVSATVLTLFWVYVISRIIHAYVHIGNNYVPLRLKLFLLGCFSLVILTGILIVNLISA